MAHMAFKGYQDWGKVAVTPWPRMCLLSGSGLRPVDLTVLTEGGIDTGNSVKGLAARPWASGGLGQEERWWRKGLFFGDKLFIA